MVQQQVRLRTNSKQTLPSTEASRSAPRAGDSYAPPQRQCPKLEGPLLAVSLRSLRSLRLNGACLRLKIFLPLFFANSDLGHGNLTLTTHHADFKVPTMCLRASIIPAFCFLLASLSPGVAKDTTNSSSQGVQIKSLPDRLRVEINGHLFTEYVFTNAPRPFLYPIIGPGGVKLTRAFPMENSAGESQDHPHHRSLWFSHGSVNGHDFWSEEKAFGKEVHEGFSEITSGEKFGIIRSTNRWDDAQEKVVCSDERMIKFIAPTDEKSQIMDFEITLKASHGDLVFGDTKEGMMAIRVAESMKLKGHGKTSRILNSAGDRNDAAWGKRADWCDYSGVVEGKTVGITIFDHPQNPRHPTWWHVRDYGLFAANPFGKHDFEKLSNPHAGDLKVPAGKSITFRYRFYFHQGVAEPESLRKLYAEYSTAH